MDETLKIFQESIVIDQGRIGIQRIGFAKNESPVMIFLHDALGSIEQWRGFPQKLVKQTGCPAIVYDRLGYGTSEGFVGSRDKKYLEREALEILPQVLRACGVQKPILIGHSDGGSIALVFAGSCSPEIRSDIQLQGVVTEAAHVFVEEETLAGIRAAVKLIETTDFKQKLSRFHGDKTNFILKGWIETWLSSDYRDWNIEKYLSQINCPSLIIQGSEDEYGTSKQVESIVSQVKGSTQALMIPQCAHVPHYQAESIVLDAMTQFVLKTMSQG